MTTAAIVVTHNSEMQAPACIDALLDAGVSVVVVDNASTDATPRLVAERFPGVRLLVNHENVGFAAAVNRALAQTRADVVLLVNPDCVVSAATPAALVSYLAANPEVGVVGPRVLDGRGRVTASAHPFESFATVVASRFGGSLVPNRMRRVLAVGKRRRDYAACFDGERPVEVDWISGACLGVRGSLLRQLGGLDSSYYLYYEDEELCLQVWRAGATVVYLPTIEAVHEGGASSSDPAHVWPHLYRSLLRFQARHRPRTFGLVRAVIVARAVPGVALGAVRDAVALVRRRPARRTLAWLRIARVAVAEKGWM